jgi:DNA-directed RNA polymerase specialized sigma24 family protein
MKDIGGFTRQEIAEELGMTSGAVKNRLTNARCVMKSYLSDWIDISEIT